MSQLLAFYMGSLILRSIGIALVAGICSWKIRNVAVRHAVWVAVLFSMMLMPVVDSLLPARWVPAGIQEFAAERPATFRVASARAIEISQSPTPPSPTVAAAVSSQSKRVDWWRTAVALYALVALAMFTRLAMGYWKIRKLRHTVRAIASSVWEEIVALHRTRWRNPVLMESEVVQVPMTVGLLRPSVILPVDWKTWDEWKLRAVLLHEVAHIHRGDWGIAVMAAVAKCAYWLNPLSWFLERKLSQLAEQASDDASLSRTQGPTRYAEILLEFAAATQNGGRLMKGGVAMAQHNMKARIERVLGNPKTGTGIVRVAGWALVIFIAAPVIYSAAALQVSSQRPPAAIPTYAAEFGRIPLSQDARPQSSTQATPPTVAIAQQSASPAAESELQKAQREYDLIRQNLAQAELQKALIDSVHQELESKATGTIDFLTAEGEKLQNQLKALQAEAEMRKNSKALLEQELANQPSTPQRGVDKLRVNEEALKRVQAQIDHVNRQIEQNKFTSPTLEIADTNSKNRVFVTGRVQRSGDLRYDKPLTVLQALALAGGFQDYARPDAISIIRMNGDSSILLQFNYSNVIKGVNTSQNIYLENGDVVVVP